MSQTRPREIQGWMGRKSLRWLRSMAEGEKTVAEVGVWRGRTTKALAALNRGTIYAVDTWGGVPDDPEQAELYPDPSDAEADFRRHLRREIDNGTVIVCKTTSMAAAEALARGGATLDVVFIDADHRYASVRDDIRAWRPLVKPGGVIAGHDYGWPGVLRAVTEELPDHRHVLQAIWMSEL